MTSSLGLPPSGGHVSGVIGLHRARRRLCLNGRQANELPLPSQLHLAHGRGYESGGQRQKVKDLLGDEKSGPPVLAE